MAIRRVLCDWPVLLGAYGMYWASLQPPHLEGLPPHLESIILYFTGNVKEVPS